VDPVTHTLAGGLLAAGGGGRRSRHATAVLLVAANLPDVDVTAYVRGPYAALALRRGLTHGPLGVLLLPPLLVGGVLLLDRVRGRRRGEEAPPLRPGALAVLAWLGALTHPLLDWMNTYGIRLLSPFSGEWFYGDALFIVDPWLWLLMGGTLLLARRARSRVGAGGGGDDPVHRSERRARAGVLVALLYILVMVGSGRAARRLARAAGEGAGWGPAMSVMVAPAPADPFGGFVVVETEEGYRLGSFRWLERPRVRFRGEVLPRVVGPAGMPRDATAALLAQAREEERVRDFLVWSRFPFFRVERLEAGYRIRVGDARYADVPGAGSLAGVEVFLPGDPVPSPDGGALPPGATPSRSSGAPGASSPG